jgi:hypothetical protein
MPAEDLIIGVDSRREQIALSIVSRLRTFRNDQCQGSSLLAPDIIESILSGCQPPDLSVQKLLKSMPIDWAEQRKQFGPIS